MAAITEAADNFHHPRNADPVQGHSCLAGVRRPRRAVWVTSRAQFVLGRDAAPLDATASLARSATKRPLESPGGNIRAPVDATVVFARSRSPGFLRCRKRPITEPPRAAESTGTLPLGRVIRRGVCWAAHALVATGITAVLRSAFSALQEMWGSGH